MDLDLPSRFSATKPKILQEIFNRIQQKRHRSTILLVEDDDILRKGYAEYLGSAGFKIVEAENGLVALDILATQKIDLIIMDVFMPVLDGLSTLARIRISSDIPVIMFSSVTNESTIAALERHGIYKFISKLALEDLLTSVKTVLAESRISETVYA